MMRDYEDIIGLPHPDPRNHPRMPRIERAAQFASFAALSGFGQVISDTEQRYVEDNQ